MKKIITIMISALLLVSFAAMAQPEICKKLRISELYYAQYNAYFSQSIDKDWGHNFRRFMEKYAFWLIVCSNPKKAPIYPHPEKVVLGLINDTGWLNTELDNVNRLNQSKSWQDIKAGTIQPYSFFDPRVDTLTDNMAILFAMLDCDRLN